MLSRTPVRPIDPVLGRVDAALFTGPMLLIGPDNAAVGIVDGHEAAALAIARGHGTTWAAQVRPGVIALDVEGTGRGEGALFGRDVRLHLRAQRGERGVDFADEGLGRRPVDAAVGD